MTKADAYRADIDGLRAIAVTSVVLCHARLGLPGGYVGVDVFYVISGYLITSLLVAGIDRGEFTFSGFWERRLRRILPALLVMVITTVLASRLVLLPEDVAALGKSVAALAVLISNVQFWRETGYFEATADEKPLLHTWSLAIEEQFYLLLPVFLFFALRSRRRRGAFPTLAALALGSFVLSVLATPRNPATSFYLLPTRAWELLAGSMLARFGSVASPRFAVARSAAATSGLVAILAPCFLYDSSTPFPGLAALPPVAGAALLIWSGDTTKPGWVHRVLGSPPMVAIGLVSYSFYLWHWPLFAIANYVALQPLSVGIRIALALASLALAYASWRLIETPVRRHEVLASSRLFLATCAVAITATLGVGLFLWRATDLDPAPLASSPVPHVREARLRDDRHFRDLTASDIPTNMPCFGKTTEPPTILVWGDSHAMALLPGIEAASAEAGLSTCAATHSSTAPAVGYAFQAKFGLNDQAPAFNEAVMRYLRSSSFRVVVLAGYWEDYWAADGRRFTDAMATTVESLRAMGLSVFVVLDVPDFGFDVPKALARYNRGDFDETALKIARATLEASRPGHGALVPLVKERGAGILDPLYLFQSRPDSSDLYPFDADGPLYSDRNHLSTHGALALKGLFDDVTQAARERASVAGEPRATPVVEPGPRS